MGYIPNCKGYKVYEIATQKIFASRDVIFYEHVMSYKSVAIRDSTDVPLPIVYDDFHLPMPSTVTDHAVADHIEPDLNPPNDDTYTEIVDDDDYLHADLGNTSPAVRRSSRARQQPQMDAGFCDLYCCKTHCVHPSSFPIYFKPFLLN